MDVLLSSFFICYLIIAIIYNKPVILLAFVACELVVYIEQIKIEYHIYLIEFIFYSYVFMSVADIGRKKRKTYLTRKRAFACGMILIISLISTIESLVYGRFGITHESYTMYHNNVEYLYMCAHCFFIYTFIHFRKLHNRLCDFINFAKRLSYNPYFFTYLC